MVLLKKNKTLALPTGWEQCSIQDKLFHQDSNNYGAYILYYFHQMLQNKPLINEPQSMTTFRRKLQCMLLYATDYMVLIMCIYCAKVAVAKSLQCQQCKRYFHTRYGKSTGQTQKTNTLCSLCIEQKYKAVMYIDTCLSIFSVSQGLRK